MTKTVAIKSMQSPAPLMTLGFVGLVLTYMLITRAIDTGSLGQYGLSILLTTLTVSTFVRAVRLIRK